MYYLDNAATTPLTKDVKDYIVSILDDYGNPSSTYNLGMTTKNIIDKSREAVKKFINCPGNGEIIFTSSGSAANALAIKGLTGYCSDYILFYSPTAHKSMTKCCENCRYAHELKVDKYGMIDLDNLKKNLETAYPTQTFVCIEVASSELGTIQPIYDIVKLVHYYDGIVVADITGYLPYYKVNILDLGVDIATFSGHKLHGLKGVGVLYKLEDIGIEPLIYGSQECGYFSGTENVIGIASLGKAVETYSYNFVSSYQRDTMYNILKNNIDNCYLVGGDFHHRLPMNLYMCFKDVDGGSLVALLEKDGILVSTGSACNNGSPDPSKALLAIKMNDNDIHSCVRFTFNGSEDIYDIEDICKKVKKAVEFLRA